MNCRRGMVTFSLQLAHGGVASRAFQLLRRSVVQRRGVWAQNRVEMADNVRNVAVRVHRRNAYGAYSLLVLLQLVQYEYTSRLDCTDIAGA